MLLLTSFATVFYPFRKHTRLIWFALAPVGVAIIPILGRATREKLLYAEPGVNIVPLSLDQILVAYLAVAGAAFLWACVYWFGVRIRQESSDHPKRYISLAELVAMTGIFCFLVLFLKEYFSTDWAYSSRHYASLAVNIGVPFAAFGICLWSILYCKRPRSAVIFTVTWYLLLIGILVLEGGIWSIGDWHQVQYMLDPIWQLTSVVVFATSIRLAGYRLGRQKKSVLKVNPVAPTEA